ncbi:hypothetical protein SAMN06297251_13037 [Fulvimarina manganoxydans]|uniref:Uncharacterized protein n=2 Tax=Fulvimarina manganoxydans TaxID=937218 RepID=A0A1W2EQB8_9HYPH|nr:hypothetical protein SAMN06297251_13037 [Fulvimarina manganoxydans]
MGPSTPIARATRPPPLAHLTICNDETIPMPISDDDAFDDAMNPDPRDPKAGKPDTDDKRRESDDVPEEELDEALEETFPASDPIAPSRIDGPSN